MASRLDAVRELEREARAAGSMPEEDAITVIQKVPNPLEDHWPEPLADEALRGIIGEVVRTIEPHTEADNAALLFTSIGFFGNAIGRGPHAIAEADRHGTNLFICEVGLTAKGRKGSGTGHIRALMNLVDPEWTASRLLGGLSSGEGLVWHVRDQIEKELPVMEGRIHTGRFQTEIVDPGVGDKRLLAYEPEFASVLKVMSRESNILSTQMRQAWDSGTLRTMTKTNATMATNTHVSVLGHSTKDELLRYLNDTEAINGFGNRFLWPCVKRSKALPEGGGRPNYQALTPRLRESLETAKTIGQLERDPEARRIWNALYSELSEGRPGLFGSIIARAEAQVLRLSVLYAALDGANAIGPDHLKAALAAWEYLEASARYIFGDATGDPIADRIMESINLFGEQTRTAINALFGRNVAASRISQALSLLFSSGKAVFERRETDGRPVEVWMAKK